jgi:phosphoribosylformylglycinamidine synthase
METIRRIYVCKRKEFAIEARHLLKDLQENLGIRKLENIRILHRYDVEGMSSQEFATAIPTVFSEPPLDDVYLEDFEIHADEQAFGIEYLPGQYDQRADSAAQCLQIIGQSAKPIVAAARIFVLRGALSEEEFLKIKKYLINPVDSREADLAKKNSLRMDISQPGPVKAIEGFIDFGNDQLVELRESLGLAMSVQDLSFCRDYFKHTEQRNPTITEIKMLDTYWSDHCRHTTFLTTIEGVEFQQGDLAEPVKEAYQRYLHGLKHVARKKDEDNCLMSIATMSMKEMRHNGQLGDMEDTSEINACSIVRDVVVNGETEEWLIMFKNETHNHPTEIEPFGGAATCLGGAIRDPLSGRAYVYQSMRITGSGDPRQKIEETLTGKLSQRKITTEAAHGFSSYGNQIGLATGYVNEIYHPGYMAKRMEVGAVIGAVPRKQVLREEPQPGDVILLVGGRTGRDGIGGATGSSKEHTEESLETAGAEVQKGNAPEERKLQRLFRKPEVTRLIKKSNDFGAGGVSVAVGELADGLEVNLEAVPKKYEGLDGTELALSESQERMAVVVSKEDVENFKLLAAVENLEATAIAQVTAEPRLKILWKGQAIVDIARDFIDTNGVRQSTKITVAAPKGEDNYFERIKPEVQQELSNIKAAWLAMLGNLDVCSQRGLVERFDNSIGRSTVFYPFGGIYRATPTESMTAIVPILGGHTRSASIMSYGFNPELSSWSPFHGAVYAVVESIAKIVAGGGDYRDIRCSLQEYFEKLGNDAEKWGKPFSALLGAYTALSEFGIAAIGGKDSMSGSFKELNVPPTLISFAVNMIEATDAVSPEFKHAGSAVVLVKAPRDERYLPEFDTLKKNYSRIHQWVKKLKISAMHTVRTGGIAEAVSKMSFGNRIGFSFNDSLDARDLFLPDYGTIVVELALGTDPREFMDGLDAQLIGTTIADPVLEVLNTKIPVSDAQSAWEAPLEKVFPTRIPNEMNAPRRIEYTTRNTHKPATTIAKPRVVVTAFPGTNSEYDTARAFRQYGGIVEVPVFRNLKSQDIQESVSNLESLIRNSQILVIPGGFSAGDEPEGSGKFIATVFRNPSIQEAVMDLLQQRDGLILGICNGFQALVKLGLLPYGEIRPQESDSPTLTFNTIGRHVALMIRTRVTSTLSPWFSRMNVGDIHAIPVSHGEGRFICSPQWMDKLSQNGQIATQYVDEIGLPSNDIAHNPNGSIEAVEGVTSPDGRVLGKMGHTERNDVNVGRNIPGNKDQQLFKAGIAYFK